jgi:hypothetical protein
MEDTLKKPLRVSSYAQLDKHILALYVATLFHQEMLDDAKDLSTDHHPLIPLLTQNFLLPYYHGKNF